MHKICAKLYLFPQCTIYAQGCTYFLNAQYMRKIVLISPMRNICTRFAHDHTVLIGMYMGSYVVATTEEIMTKFGGKGI